MKLPTFTVTAYRFDRGLCMPRRIEVDGVAYSFNDRGLHMHVTSSTMRYLLVALTDGSRTFHLRADARGSSWELVKVV